MPLQGFSEFSWRTMTTAINQIAAPPMLLQDLIFRQKNVNLSEYVDVDVVIGGKYVAPFVTAVDGGVLVDKMGREVRSVQTPRIRVKKAFSAADLVATRAPGSSFYAEGGITQYRQQCLAQELQDLKNRIITTKEWMCSQALTGVLTVTQNDPPLSFTVDYNLPSAHKPTLGGTDVWGGTTADIMGDLDDWSNLIINAVGVGPDVAILGKNALAKLRADEEVRNLLDNRRTEAGQFAWKATSNYLGNLNGIDLYRYGTTYVDASGTSANFVDDDVCILVATNARFSIEHGLILDLDAGEVPTQYFSKSWTEKDPSVAWILAESRPLPVPWQPEAIVYATVL